MKQELFEELLESVKEAKAIIKGEKEPSRIFIYDEFIYDELDVKSIREQFGLSQSKFASLLGISLGTLRNWEQGRRKPQGPARVLLRVAQKQTGKRLTPNPAVSSKKAREYPGAISGKIYPLP
jgi:putative transcriptional regulator